MHTNNGDEEMKNKDMPAMPQPMVECDGQVYTTFDNYGKGPQSGLTKREMFALKLMAAYRTQHEVLGAEPEQVAGWAIDDADALLKELEK